MIAVWLASSIALATGLSSEVELVRPTLSPGGPIGVDTPWIEAPGTLRVGAVMQYERDPLVLYERGEEAGNVITHRQALHLGAALDLGRGASVRAVLPAAMQWGSEVPALAGDGAGLGDIRLGLRAVPPLEGPGRIGVRADLALPTGTREAWMAEQTPRLSGGLLAGLASASLQATAELGIEARAVQDSGLDLAIGPELFAGAGLRYLAWPEVAAIHAGVVARTGLSTLADSAGARPAEALTGLSWWPSDTLQVDLGVGRGLSPGYGTTEMRAIGGLTWIRRPPPPPPPSLPRIQLTELEDAPLPPPPPPPPPDERWDDGELARVEEERIVIREPIQFAYATDRILQSSRPTLSYVAGLLAEHWSIGHLVVEGHASDEGSFSYNYELSIQRARAVWEALVAEGVHPDRISYRGMGEVAPRADGEDEASLAQNRRVEFRIVWRRTPGEAEQTPLVPSGTSLLPWNGQAVELRQPPEPQPQPTPEAEPDPDSDIDIDILQVSPAPPPGDDSGENP